MGPGSVGGAGWMGDVAFQPHTRVRMAFIGAGGRGRTLMRNFRAVEGVEVTAVCDRDRDSLARVQGDFHHTDEGSTPVYLKDVDEALHREDVDLVCVATSWDSHAPLAVAAMEAGKHVCVEVPAATTTDDCWRLVDASERTRRHCVMLENCCYGYCELLLLRMIRAGVLGEVLHAEAAYIHDLRGSLFSRRTWRRLHHVDRDGNLYPTHGLGPVAGYLGINRGDRFDHLVSMSSPHRGLELWRESHLDRSDPAWAESYVCGDLNTSLIKASSGRTVLVQHNVTSPRPYDRLNLVAGTKGTYKDFPPRIYLDGQDGEEEYVGLDGYRERFEHAWWKEYGRRAREIGGHGGMDFIMAQQLVYSMLQGTVPDMDVYDAATWSVIGPLSEDSVRLGSVPVAVPDFTRGRWSAVRPTVGDG